MRKTLLAIFNQVFNENLVIVMLKSAAGGWACGRAGVNFWFPVNNFSLLWPIDTKLSVWVAYIKRQLGIPTHVSVIKVNVTVTKNKKISFRSITGVCFGLFTQNLLYM